MKDAQEYQRVRKSDGEEFVDDAWLSKNVSVFLR